MDLRMEEIFMQSELFELVPGRAVIVLAGDALEDAAFIQGPNDFRNFRA